MMLGFEAITIGKVNETLEMFLFCTVYLLLGKLAAKFCWVQHFSIVVLAFFDDDDDDDAAADDEEIIDDGLSICM